MDGRGHILSLSASRSNISNNKNPNNGLGTMMPSAIPTVDDGEADDLNDETFGDCDLDKIKIKSDFGENGEFLGENSSGDLPDFFDSDIPDTSGYSLLEHEDQSQSIDALLGEDPMRVSIRQSTTNPLFNMAISQARNENIFSPKPIPRVSQMPLPPPPPPASQQQINYQLLKQFEQLLISRQVPPQERMIYIQAMIEKMQPEPRNIQPQPPNLRHNGHQPPQSMAIGETMERARLTAMNTNNSRTQSPSVPHPGMSSQLMDAIQRSDQIPIVDNHQNPSIPPHHHPHPPSNQSRQNRSARHYPRPPLLNTWQGRGSGHDEFAGMMSDREKQWVVKIQLHQVSQSQEEDYYFHQWSQQKRQKNQSNRPEQRTQRISYPVLQLLKSIQQEKEFADRLSQSSIQATFSNVNPSQTIPYASPIHSQLGKQSTATPRHPRCTLHLDGQMTLGTGTNSITHDKYTLGLLLNIENLYRDLLQIDSNDSTSVNSIIERYLNDQKYFFPDMFGQFNKGQLLLQRLYPSLIASTTGQLELVLVRIYSSLSYMVRRWPTTFHLQLSVSNTISLLQQQVNVKKTTFEQILAQIYTNYKEQIHPKLLQFDSNASSSPFSDPTLFTNSQLATLLIELLLILERQCYLLSGANSSTLPIHMMQQLQPQLQYQLSEHVRFVVNDLCQALIACSSVKKSLKPFAQVHQQQFGLLCKFIRIQTSAEIYAAVEPKLIFCCIKS